MSSKNNYTREFKIEILEDYGGRCQSCKLDIFVMFSKKLINIDLVLTKHVRKVQFEEMLLIEYDYNKLKSIEKKIPKEVLNVLCLE